MILRAAAEPRRRYIERTDYESYVSPGEVITAHASDCIRGHGTFVRRGRVVASISGTVEWMDRLVWAARPLKSAERKCPGCVRRAEALAGRCVVRLA